MMQQVKDLIHKHNDSHNEFEYYYSIIEKIEENINSQPDISIESSKALIEGICKTILLNLDSSYTKSKLNSYALPKLFKTACDLIDEKIIDEQNTFEIDFTSRAANLVLRMAELRNERGDISHGKPVPKEDVSTKECANMVMQVTNAVVSYILKVFFSIDLSYREETEYEDNPKFNEFLDENYPLDGLYYSKALFDQDFVEYDEQFSAGLRLIIGKQSLYI